MGKIDGDIKSWVSEIKKEDDKMHFHETDTFPVMEDHLPPVRGANSHLHVAKEKILKVDQLKRKFQGIMQSGINLTWKRNVQKLMTITKRKL